MKRYLILLIFLALIHSRSYAQQSVGSIVGHIHLSNPDDAQSLHLVVEEITTEAKVETAEVDTSGDFVVRNLPYATYDLYLYSQSNSVFAKRVTINSAVPVRVEIDSVPTFQGTEITVTDTHLEATQPTVHTLFTAPVILTLPVTNPAKGIEAVLLNSPGVVPDEDGRLHIRGEDAMLQYVVDGIPLTTNQTRIYAPLFDANFIESADLLRGSLDPEYGVAASGVLNVTTKSGFDATNFGHAEYSVGTFNNGSQGIDFGGHIGQAVAYYGAYGSFHSDRYLDPVSGFDPNHTAANGSDYFGKINVIASDKIDITALGYYGSTHLQIPNHTIHGPQDQTQDLMSLLFGARVNYTLSNSSVLSLLGYTRRQTADVTSNGLDQLSTSGDSATNAQQRAEALSSERYFVGAHRKDIESGGQLEYSAKTDWFGGDNEFKLGAGGEVFPISEFFTFAVTDSNISDPNFPGGDVRLQNYDITKDSITRGSHPRPFLVDTNATGKRISAYVQDHLTTGDWTLSGGLRFDMYDLLDKESGLSPRLNIVYRASDQLILRASYNRMFMEAPIENMLVSSSAAAGALVGANQNGAPRIVQSEKSHVFELGAGYRLSKYISLDLTGFGKLIDNMIVKVELGNSGIIFPANIKQGVVAGGELEVLLRDWNHLSGRLAVASTVSKGVVPSDGSSPFAAGLVLGEEGENYSNPFKGENMFNTEHNQLLTASFTLRYDHPIGVFALIGGRFDSGLPFDLLDTGTLNKVGPDAARSREILLKRGYSEATVNMLNLNSDLPGSPDKSVAAHATFDMSLGYNLAAFGLPVRIIGTVTNILNTQYLIKFESTFGGTHFGAPRMFLLRAELTS
jgi:outer membrane cobalamin receptor